jgi:DNA repair exonuclease SbcCD nuclease subunit
MKKPIAALPIAPLCENGYEYAMRILHCADVHLGRRRLDGRLPETDFAVAFGHIVARAIEWKADVLLIAGDLFDSPQIPPPVLRQAATALAPLRKGKTLVLAIEGNHDRHLVAGTRATWVRYLAEEGLLTLLSVPFTAEGPRLAEYDPQTLEGGLLEHQGVRFVGAGYLGAGTPRKLQALLAALAPREGPTVMLLHAGPEYFVGETGGFDRAFLRELHGKVAYLALGHIHKPMAYGDESGQPWAINPGSPENCRLEESGQPQPRGWAEVELDPKALPGLSLQRVEICDCPRRTVLRIELDISAFGNKLKAGVEAVTAAALKALQARKHPADAAVRLILKGELNIGRIAIEPSALGLALAAQAGVAAVEVNTDDLKLYTGRGGAERPLLNLSTAEIERQALEEVLKLRPPADLEDRLPEAAQLAVQLRELVARGTGPEAVLELLEQSPLPARLAEAREKALG